MSTAPRVLQNGRLMPWLEQQLRERYQLTRLADQPDPDRFLHECGSQFEALATSARAGASRALLDSLPNLRVISSFGVGYDAVDLEATRARGIPVGYTPDTMNDCVADTAFGLLLNAVRGFTAADRFVRRGEWLAGEFPLTRRVSGRKLGILGLGRIGQVVARRAQGFDMEVRYHNRRPVDNVSYRFSASLVALAEWADDLVVTAAGGADTRGMVTMQVLRALGPQGVLVNVARGSVVEQADLLQALREGVIAGAGLDVYWDEPRVPPELMAMENVVLLPHAASSTHDARRAIAQRVIENLESFFRTGRVSYAVPA